MRFRDSVLRNIVSPYGLALISYAFFLFACLVPPSTYRYYAHEPDLMFLDPVTILFYTLCVVAFMAGAGLVGWLFPSTPFVERQFTTRISPTLFLLAPLLAGIALTAISAFRLIEQNPGLIFMLLTQQGGDLKEIGVVDVEGTLTTAPLILIATIWWAYWRSSDLDFRGWKRWLVRFSLSVAVLLAIFAAILILSRNLVMLVACGLAILYVARRITRKNVSFKFVIGVGASIVTCIILLFFTFSFIRGAETWDYLAYNLVGYTIASYNRLAAMVNGTLHYPFAGHGVYLSYFGAYNHALNQVVPLGSMMNAPQFLDLWGSEFGAIDRAGLDGGAIWSGAFGYIFSDLGWFSVLFVFGYGLLYGFVWNWMKNETVFGFVIYPFFGFCALFWLGTNYLLGGQVATLLVIATIFFIYERLFLRPLAPVAG